MELTMEKKGKERYIISRDGQAIDRDREPYINTCALLNNLIKVMSQTEYKLTTKAHVEECISKGAILYVKEKIVANADVKAIKALYGFIPDCEELIRIAPTPPGVSSAEAICLHLRKDLALEVGLDEFNFDGGKFTVDPEIIEQIINRHTRYSASKTEEKLIRRLKELTMEINDLREQLIDYAPNIYQDQWSHPEQLLTWDPVTKSYKPDLESLVKIFNLRKVS